MLHATGRLGWLASLSILLVLTLSFFVLASPAQANESTRWCSQVPFPTGDDLFGISMAPPPNSDVIWAVGGYASTGVYRSAIVKSTDGGSTWEIQNAGVEAELLGIAAVNDSVAWAVGEFGKILKTVDGGLTWTEQTSGTGQDLYQVSALSATTAWAVGWNGTILKTTDGTTWNPQTAPHTDAIYGVSAFSATHAWAVDSSARIYVTTNGTDWNTQLDHSANQETLNSVCAVDDNNAYAVGQRWGTNKASIYRTTNGGTNWDLVDPEPSQYHLRSVAAADATHAWTVGDYGLIFATTDGTTWTAQTSPLSFSLNAVDCTTDGQVAFVAGAKGSLLGTTNAGTAWNPLSMSFNHQAYGVAAPDTDTAYVTCWQAVPFLGQVYKTTDAGATWTKKWEVNRPLFEVSAPSRNVVWIAARDGLIYRSINGGTDWDTRYVGTSTWCRSVSAVDENIAWAVGDAGGTGPYIFKTTDGGQNWSPQTSPVAQSLLGVSAVDGQTAWAVGSNGSIIKTTDGVDWVIQTCPVTPAQYLNGVSAIDADTAWAVGYDGTSGSEKGIIIKTIDGTHWTEQTSGTANAIQSVSACDAGNAYAVGADLLQTTNGGADWNIEPSPVSASVSWSAVAAPAAGAAWVTGNWNVLHTHSITSITPALGPPGTRVTIRGGGFGSSQGNGHVMFGDVPASGFGSWSDTEITCFAPNGVSGAQQVRVANRWGRTLPATFTVEAPALPQIVDMSLTSGAVGDTVTLTGSNFGLPDDLNPPRVNFGGVTIPASAAVSWTRTRVEIRVPPGAYATMTVSVTTSVGTSTPAIPFTVRPAVTGLSPGSGLTGTEVTLTGTSFGSTRGTSYVSFGSVRATEYPLWGGTQVKCKVPAGASGTVPVTVTTEFGTSNSRNFTVTAQPAASSTWYLAEGSTAWGFTTWMTIMNPNKSAVQAKVTYMPTGRGNVQETLTLPAESQTTLSNDHLLQVMGSESDFSTKVESVDKSKPIAIDRTMEWSSSANPEPEAHSSIGVTAPAETWYLPEGSSAWGFECWLLIQNPNPVKATCQVTYMIEGQAPETKVKEIAPNTRASFDMARDIGAENASIKVTSDVPVIPERAMYRNERSEGHDSIGTTTPANAFYLAEGTTAWGFTTYVLVQNPNASPVNVTITYMTGSGPRTQPAFSMPANSRKTIKVNDSLQNADFSTRVQGSKPIIAERAMYWDCYDQEKCHDSIGMDQPHATFYLPDGDATANYGVETWTLVQNPNSGAVAVEVTYMTPSGKGNVTFTDTIPANSRRTYNMADRMKGSKAAIMVKSKTTGKKIMCERAMYWANRSAGTDTIGGYSD